MAAKNITFNFSHTTFPFSCQTGRTDAALGFVDVSGEYKDRETSI